MKSSLNQVIPEKCGNKCVTTVRLEVFQQGHFLRDSTLKIFEHRRKEEMSKVLDKIPKFPPETE